VIKIIWCHQILLVPKKWCHQILLLVPNNGATKYFWCQTMVSTNIAAGAKNMNLRAPQDLRPQITNLLVFAKKMLEKKTDLTFVNQESPFPNDPATALTKSRS